MLSKKSFIILSPIIFITCLTIKAQALEYSSYIFTIRDIIFFSYKNGTFIEIYDSSDTLIWDNDGNTLDKGKHVRVPYPEVLPRANEVYKVCGSKKFAVLTGDPATNGISGYYAMDANGLGTCKEFYTYVPTSYPEEYSDHQLFIVFAYQDNTQVTVQRDIGNGVYQNVAPTFTLNKGKHWANSGISNKYLHIIADKPVSALTCHDQSYFVPSADGRWSGTEFYTYLSGIVEPNNGWPADLTVISYHDGTSVSIRDSNDSNTTDPIWEGTLDSGNAYVKSYPNGVYKYFTVTSSKPVTVSAQPWVAWTDSCRQEVFIPDRIGTGVGTDLIGSTLDGDLAYLYILAHKDNTHVELYNSNNGYRQASYTLNMGQAVNANPGNGLWRIVSDKDISAYSGGGDYGVYAYAAEFAPLAFNTFHLFSLKKVDVNEPNSVIPGDYITYEITYGPNGVDHNNVVITDYLPYEVDYENFDPNYNPDKHTYTWQIGSLAANDPNKSVTLTVKVNKGAAPLGKITNYCEIESDTAYKTAIAYTNVGSWEPNSQIIYVDRLSPCAPGTGMSWENAYRDLQDALARARAGCGSEIWVAAGTYKPTQNPSDTAATFQLVNGVPVYGGFSGNETSRNQRNWLTNQTILTGDINNDRTGDAVCVVTASNDVGPATIIDGFTIIKGSQVGIYCNGGSPTIAHNTIKENYYDGIYCDGASPIITQNTIEQNNNLWGIDCRNNSSPDIKACWIQDNATGGIGCDNSNPNITDCLITRNGNESGDGGGIYNDSSSPTVTNCVFRENRARYGGGIYNQYYSSPRVTNCTFRGNTADYYGGGMNNEDNSSPVATNCIFWGNEAADGNEIYNTYSSNPTVSYCDIQGETVYPGTANINTDPLFYDANDPNSYHLTGNSPCIDKGNNSAVPPSVLTDIDGEARVKDGDSDGNKIVDIGADEYYLSPADFNDDLTVNFFDYALFANVWQSNDPGFSLDGDNDVDYNDLVLFCEDWLWQAGWTKTFTCGAGKGMSQTMTAGFAPIKTSSQSILAEQQIEQVEPLKIEQLIKWLEELWLDEETQKLIDEDVWLKFMESLKEEQ